MIRNRNFILLWVVTIVTTFAVELYTITILVAVYEQTGSTLQAAGALVARSVPALFLGPIAGVLVDRFRRDYVLVSMDLLRLLLIGFSVWLLSGDQVVPVLWSYLILAGLSSAELFHQPARLALIPAVVTKDELVNANSQMMVSRQITLAISYAIGGQLILLATMQQIAFGIGLLFVIAIVAGLLIRLAKSSAQTEQTAGESVFGSFVSGWRYLLRHPIARPLTIMESVEHVPHGIWTGAIMLAFTIEALHSDAAGWGTIITSYFAGMIVGGLASLVMGDWLKRYPGRIIVASASLAGFLTLGFAVSPNVLVASALAFVFGPPFAVRDVAQDALLQGTVAANQLGRVYAARDMSARVVFMCSGLFFAWLSAYVPIRVIYVIGGIIYLMTGAYALSNKPLRESKMTIEPQAAALD